jgi:hypothetical protein
MMPFGEWRPDVSDYQTQYANTALNVIPRGDGYGPVNSLTSLTEALPAPCRGYFYARKSDGSVQIYAGTATKLYLLDNTDFTWDDVSKSGGTYTSLSAGAQWQFTQFNNFVIAVQANAPVQVFEMGTSSAFADLAGSPPQAAYVTTINRFVVLSGLANNPYRIQWSGLNAVTTWTSGTSQSDYQDLPDGGLVRSVAGGEAGIIFQDGAIRRMTYAPGSPVIFQIERISEEKGIYGPYSLVRSGDRVFFLSSQGFHVVTPGSYPEPIGKERVDRYFLDDLDRGNLQLLIGASDPRSTRVFWAYKSNSGATGVFDKILCFDWALNRWSTINTSGEFIASLSQPGITLESLDDISASLDALTASLDSYATSTTPEISVVDTLSKVSFFRGEYLEATLETAEQGEAGKRLFIQGFRGITDAPMKRRQMTRAFARRGCRLDMQGEESESPHLRLGISQRALNPKQYRTADDERDCPCG